MISLGWSNLVPVCHIHYPPNGGHDNREKLMKMMPETTEYGKNMEKHNSTQPCSDTPMSADTNARHRPRPRRARVKKTQFKCCTNPFMCQKNAAELHAVFQVCEWLSSVGKKKSGLDQDTTRLLQTRCALWKPSCCGKSVS